MSKITLLLCHLSPLHSSSCLSHVPACKTFAIISPFLMGKLHQRLLLPIAIANSDCFDQSHQLQLLLHVKLSKIKVKEVLLKLTWWFRGAGATRTTCLRKMRFWLPAGFAPCCSLPLRVCVVTDFSFPHSAPFFPFLSTPVFTPVPLSAAGGKQHPPLVLLSYCWRWNSRGMVEHQERLASFPSF